MRGSFVAASGAQNGIDVELAGALSTNPADSGNQVSFVLRATQPAPVAGDGVDLLVTDALPGAGAGNRALILSADTMVRSAPGQSRMAFTVDGP